MTNKKEIRIPWGSGIVGHVAATARPVNIRDCYADDRFNRVSMAISGSWVMSADALPVNSDTLLYVLRNLLKCISLLVSKSSSNEYVIMFSWKLTIKPGTKRFVTLPRIYLQSSSSIQHATVVFICKNYLNVRVIFAEDKGPFSLSLFIVCWEKQIFSEGILEINTVPDVVIICKSFLQNIFLKIQAFLNATYLT